jgi:glycosyltransferase involved in cell wall biosynthesis
MIIQNPKVSVIMPVYNASKFLAESIESILNQTFENFELIILNDFSNDNSKEIIELYSNKDQRITFIDKKENVGPASLRNEGIEIAKGEFIALNDSDDISLPTRFEKQLQVFEKDLDLFLCGSWYTIFGENLKEKIIKNSESHEKLKVDFLDNCYVGNSTVMFRKSLLGNNRFKSEFVIAEDYELWDRLIKKYKFYNIQESLVFYRWHETNISKTKKDNIEKALRQIKLQQFSYLGIENQNNIEDFTNAIIFIKNLNPEAVKAAIISGKVLIENNSNLQRYDLQLFNKHIEKVLIKTIRKASYYNKDFYKVLKAEKWIFDKIPLIDKVLIKFKSLS